MADPDSQPARIRVDGEEEEASDDADRSSVQESSSGEGDDLMELQAQDEASLDAGDEYDEAFLASDGEDRDGPAGDQRELIDRVLDRAAAERVRKRDDKERAAKRRRLADGVGKNIIERMEDDESDEESLTMHGSVASFESAATAAQPDRAPSAASSESSGFGDEEASSEEGDVLDFTDNFNDNYLEWLSKENVRRDVKRKFRTFLRTSDDGYIGKIGDMVTQERSSLNVNHRTLAKHNRQMAMFVAELPSVMLSIFDEVAEQETRRLFPKFAAKIGFAVHVRITELSVTDTIRGLRCQHMNMLVRLCGVVTRRSQVYPQLQTVKFDCMSCGALIGPMVFRGSREAAVKMCPVCQVAGPFRLNSQQIVYRNYQTVVLQESPGRVPPGRLPRQIECILLQDLVDRVRPGEEVDVTGVYRSNFDAMMNHKQGFPVFASVMEVNYIKPRASEDLDQLSLKERLDIQNLGRHPRIIDKIVASIAPGIHGHTEIKSGVACSLFGGVGKEVGDSGKVRIRGDINVLLIGDPGCGKSQILKYIEKTSPRAVFTTGRGSTAVGLTAAVQRDAMTGEWTLEGGALVIADQGHCLIDEFDKMSDIDRTSIHEAMEQQTISIAKAGIVTQLQARCAVVAAANPVAGSYDPSQSFEKQCNLTQPILSRFDLLFAVRDKPDAEHETQLARFIYQSHIRNWVPGQLCQADVFPSDDAVQGNVERVAAMRMQQNDEDMDPDSPKPFPQDFLRKYIAYARKIKPKVERIDFDRVESFYTSLRKDQAMIYETGVKIVVRHLESIIRLSEAHARMRLSEYVHNDDVDRAIALFLNCFLQTMPARRQRELMKKYVKYLVPGQQENQVLFHVLATLAQETRRMLVVRHGGIQGRRITVDFDSLVSAADSYNIGGRAIAEFVRSYPRLRQSFKVVTKSGLPQPKDHLDVQEFELI
eukprot:TRINITY_DN1551_c16_g1_i1.p1 TRINITY_DN1551_c16_g1~~TRINITY_DN1551_c16_g1_i1.p1  ORF type:complete len:952 (+),score=292.63 TRINITY_DN1551_c16_g1_i1:56-2857(+)